MARKFLLHAIAAIILLISLVASALGDATPAPSQSPLPPGVQIKMNVTPKLVTIGDPIRIAIDITVPAGYQANIPAIEKQVGEFSIFEASTGSLIHESGQPEDKGGKRLAPDVPVHYKAQIVATAYRPGSLVFPPIPINLRVRDGKQIAIKSPPVKIEIQSVLTEKDKDLKDLKKQVDIPEPVRWGLWLTVLLALGILAAVAWLLWKRRRKHVPAIPEAPPRDLLEIAETELRELLDNGLPEDRAVKPFYVRLSDIVKKILEAGYGINTAEQTTSEILEAVGRAPGIKSDDMRYIESFLCRCDLVKFAKYIPSAAEHESALKDAFGILEISRRLVSSRQTEGGIGTNPGGGQLPAEIVEKSY